MFGFDGVGKSRKEKKKGLLGKKGEGLDGILRGFGMGLVMATEIEEDGPHLLLERVSAFLQLQFSPFVNLQIYPAPNASIHDYFRIRS